MKKTIIIGEAGVNHNGNLVMAKKLIDAAVAAKVDYVKFQTFIPGNVISKFAEKADYQKETTSSNESQLDMVKKLQLSVEDHKELINYCQTKQINFLSTPFDLTSIDILKDLGVKIGKVPSGEMTNLPYLIKMANSFKEIILSTGMSTMDEIENTLQIFSDNGISKSDITILHCNTEYPTPMRDVNLLAINTIREKFKTNVGYSDHTLGIEIPIAAVALGATIIEKHFTLDKSLTGPDHKASLDPLELIKMVNAIRNIDLSMGDGNKTPSQSEIKNIVIARKSIVAGRAIKKGELFSEDNITTKRPGNGISPMKWFEVIGKIAMRNYELDEPIQMDV